MEVEQRLQRYPWPGNVRELKNVIERAILLEAEKELLPEHIPSEIVPTEGSLGAESERSISNMVPISIKEMEKMLIHRTLDETDGNKSKAARILGISRQTLREKTKMYESE